MMLQVKKRQRILAQIHNTWIKGLLDPSLANVPYIPLPLQSWAIEDADKSSQHIAISSSELIDTYHANKHRLIILGDEGAGKTTLLLELLRDLLLRAEQDEQAPIPVVFHLSSWTTKCQRLEAWLAEEWSMVYQGEGFAAGKLLLLLDGFDAIREELKGICFQAIMAYQSTYTHIPLVLCCNNNDYERFQSPEKPHSVVQIQPLSNEQIDTYISHMSYHQAAVRAALDAKPELYPLLRRPLPLEMLTQLYQGPTQVDITGSDLSERLYNLCGAYIRSQLVSQKNNEPQTLFDSLSKLTWLAGHLWQDQIVVIHLEQLWPRWLPSKLWVLFYRLLMSLMTLLIVLIIASDTIKNWNYLFISACLVYVVIFFFSRHPIDVNTSKTFFRGGWLWLTLGQIPVLIPVPQAVSISWPGIPVIASEVVLLLIADSINKFLDKYVFPFRSWITRAGRYATISGLLTFLFVTIYEGISTNGTEMHYGLIPGLSLGLCFWMAMGGDVFIEHWIIRFCFWRTGSIPWRYREFLDAQVEHKLLFRIGSNYLFRHQMFLRYFASLPVKRSGQQRI